MALTRKKTQRSKSSSGRTKQRKSTRVSHRSKVNRKSVDTKTKKKTTRSSTKKQQAEKEVSAGGVVFKRKGRRVWFAMMQDSYGKWTFPKGHVEKGEDIEEAAARETLEELGLQEIRFLEDLGTIDIWFRDQFEKRGTLIHKDIHYFLFDTLENAKLSPDPTQHVKDAKWIPISRAIKQLSYEDMNKIVIKAIGHVKEIMRDH